MVTLFRRFDCSFGYKLGIGLSIDRIQDCESGESLLSGKITLVCRQKFGNDFVGVALTCATDWKAREEAGTGYPVEAGNSSTKGR